MSRFSMKKLLRGSELNESVSLCLSVGLWLSQVGRIITYEWTAAIDVLGTERRVTLLLSKAFSNRVNYPFYLCQENCVIIQMRTKHYIITLQVYHTQSLFVHFNALQADKQLY